MGFSTFRLGCCAATLIVAGAVPAWADTPARPGPSGQATIPASQRIPDSDLGVTIDDDVDPVTAGQPIAYTVTVANQGPSAALNTVVTIALSDQLTPVETVGCDEDPTGWPVCSLETIPDHGVGGFLLRTVTATDARGRVAMTATASSDSTDPNPADNTATESTQLTGEILVGRGGAPAIAGDLGASSRFVVAWEDSSPGDAPRTANAIRARLFSADGMPIGVELQVDSGSAASRGEADTVFTAGSELVVAWHEDGADGDGYGVRARRFDADGMPIGVELEVNSTTANDQTDPAVAALGSGVVVAWADEHLSGAWRHAARRFDGDGMPIGVELHFGDSGIVATPPTVAAAPDGSFLVAWRDALDHIAAQRFSVDGMPIGVELQVDSGAGTVSAAPKAVWHPDGSWFVAWQNDSDGDGDGVFARFVATDGMPIGVELQVNTGTAGEQTEPTVAVDLAGELAVAWQSDDGDGAHIRAQRLAPDGMPIGVELQVDRTPTGVTSRPAVTYVEDGQFYVAWQRADSDGDGSDEIVGGEPPLVFSDDFESGDTGAWSGSGPSR